MTFEPLSDSQLSDKGSKVTYAIRARLADGLGTRLATSNFLASRHCGSGNISVGYVHGSTADFSNYLMWFMHYNDSDVVL